MDKLELENLLARIDIWLLIFGVVVVVGVAGESIFGIRHWWNSRKLQEIQKSESQAQQLEIARLNKDISDAKAAQQQVELELVKQREVTAKAQADAAQAKLRAAELAIKTERTSQFVEGLALQQQGMARQIQGVPSLGDAQVNIITERLRPFAGQHITIHSTMDTSVIRLGSQFKRAFELAQLKVITFSEDMGAQYQGVVVAVKKSQGSVPQMGETLLGVIQSLGIKASGAINPTVGDADVALYLGPE